jgi:hypothetical protein
VIRIPHPKQGYSVNGQKVPGVTTILGRWKESGGLLQWAFSQGKAAERGEITNLYDKRDEAGSIGTLAHAFVEAHIRKEPAPDTSGYTEEMITQAKQGYENYLRWQEDSRLVIAYSEEEMVSQKHMFGGCLDCVFEKDGVLSLGDFKTSNAIYTDYLCQVAAYAILWDECHPDKPITGGFHLLRFAKEHADFAHHYWSELDQAKQQFLLFVEAYALDKILKKRV